MVFLLKRLASGVEEPASPEGSSLALDTNPWLNSTQGYLKAWANWARAQNLSPHWEPRFVRSRLSRNKNHDLDNFTNQILFRTYSLKRKISKLHVNWQKVARLLLRDDHCP
ncbi:hypothetical protein TNCV_4751871 [Trichonephila clavipes]|nr:hypothetical protein TNCV_4751871 [Trichonephila clavipes]